MESDARNMFGYPISVFLFFLNNLHYVTTYTVSNGIIAQVHVKG